MTKRYKNAFEITVGACNPSGICHAVIEACQEIRDEPGFTGTDQICRDPAVRLMVNQLGFLVGNPEMDFEYYQRIRRACQVAVERLEV